MCDKRVPGAFVSALAIAVLVTTATLRAQTMPGGSRPSLAGRHAFAKPGTPLRAERVRTFDVLHIKADLTLDVAKGEIRGTVTHRITPLHPNLKSVELDCGSGLRVSAVKVGRPAVACAFVRKGETLEITLNRAYQPDESVELSISYSGAPRRGIFFIKPTPEYPKTPESIWTQGETESTHDWLPCYDYPNDRATSEMIVTVNRPWFVVSNGALVESKKNDDHTTTYHWKMDVPHVSYLISLAAADFAVYRDTVGSLPVEYYVSKTVDEATARRALGKTPRMISFFSDRLDMAYPYPKYAQVFVPEFSGGQENISATTLSDYALFDSIAGLERNDDSMVAHELAHQWFGDFLTCRDWSHIWLNEGFATYFSALFTENDAGEDAFHIRMADYLQGYLSSDRAYRRPLVESRYDSPDQMFDGVTYCKGACILHCLRGLLGEKAWWNGIRRYVRTNKAQVVTTADFRQAMEAASGQDLGWFFDQWTAKAGHPELKVRWRYDQAGKKVRVKVEQVQNVDESTPLFRLPTSLELVFDSQVKSVPIVIDRATHEFVIDAPTVPKMVEIDPWGWLVKDLDFPKSEAELLYQLEHSPCVLGRLDAARALAKLKQDGNAAVVKALAAALSREQTPTARAAIVAELANGDAAHRSTLLKSAYDRDAGVRVASLDALAKLKRDNASESLLRSVWANTQEAYGARSAALKGLIAWQVDDRDELLAAALQTPSWHETLAATALELITENSTPRARDMALLYSKYGQPVPLRLKAVAALGRKGKEDKEIQDELIDMIDDPNRSVRYLAWSNLAQLGVKRALETLQARVADEDQSAKQRLLDAIATLKPTAAPSHADDVRGIADPQRRPTELERPAKQIDNSAQALRLKDEHHEITSSSTRP